MEWLGLVVAVLAVLVAVVLFRADVSASDSSADTDAKPKVAPATAAVDAASVVGKAPTTSKKKKEEDEPYDAEKHRENAAREAACHDCSVPCDEHPSYPKGINKSINKHSYLSGSVKAYHKHLVMCSGTDSQRWPKKMENVEGSYAKAFNDLVNSRKDDIGYKVKLTYSEKPSPGVEDSIEAQDVMVFPDMIKYGAVSLDQMPALVEQHLVKRITCESLSHEKMTCKAYVLVCAHKLRDKRCGVTGLILVNEFRSYIAKQGLDMEVLAVSHIGGHKFAGNVIVYPSGVWYGRVQPCHVPTIVDKTCVQGEIIEPLCRGKILAAPDPTCDMTW